MRENIFSAPCRIYCAGSGNKKPLPAEGMGREVSYWVRRIQAGDVCRSVSSPKRYAAKLKRRINLAISFNNIPSTIHPMGIYRI